MAKKDRNKYLTEHLTLKGPAIQINEVNT